MNFHTTLVSTAVYLAFNLMVFGSVIAFVVAVAFKLLPTTLPRARYLIAVAAFCAALTLPILATLGLTARSSSPPAMDERTRGPASGKALSIGEGAASGRAPAPSLVTRIAQRLARGAMAPVFFWLWLAVSALLALRELVGHMRLLRARRGWRPATDAMRLALNWPDRVPLYLGHSEGPSAVGWLRPAVALPSWLFDDLPPMTARRIAAHELAHARWRDPMVNALLRMALALSWPAAPLWFLERLAGVEREAAADQAAIDGDNAEMKQAALDYADSLVSIAGMEESGDGSRVFGLIATHAGGRRSLEIRVSRLLQEAPRGAAIRLALGLAALLGGLACSSWLPAAVIGHIQESGSLPERVVFHPSGSATLIRKTADGEVEEPALRRSEAELKASAFEQVIPSLPEELRANSGAGAVMVFVLIDENGNVISARAGAGSRHPLVEQIAVEAARRWRFAPAKMEGRAIKVVGDLTFFGQMDRSKRWIEIR